MKKGEVVFWDEEQLNILRGMIDRKIRMRDISKHYGRSPGRIYQVMSEHGIKPLTDPNVPRYRTRKEYWATRSLINYRSRAKLRNMDFDLTYEFLLGLLVDHCPVLGIPLNYQQKPSPRRYDDSPSLDRIDNTKGYTQDNVEIISWRANSMKNKFGIEELEQLLTWMKEHPKTPKTVSTV